jgi:hypothetical protein
MLGHTNALCCMKLHYVLCVQSGIWRKQYIVKGIFRKCHNKWEIRIYFLWKLTYCENEIIFSSWELHERSEVMYWGTCGQQTRPRYFYYDSAGMLRLLKVLKYVATMPQFCVQSGFSYLVWWEVIFFVCVFVCVCVCACICLCNVEY